MVNELDVFEILRNLTDISSSETQQALDLCCQCFDSLEKELKCEADTDDPRFLNAVAAKAFYLICVKEKSAQQSGVKSFKAGDLSISQSCGEIDGKLKTAEALYEKEMKKLLPLLEDTGFYAGKVDIL